MTISEFVQAQRIRHLRENAGPELLEPFDCGNGVKLLVTAGSDVAECFPRSDSGPWTAFRVECVGATVPHEFIYPNHAPRSFQAGQLVKLLERLGWPERQLGARWKRAASPARGKS